MKKFDFFKKCILSIAVLFVTTFAILIGIFSLIFVFVIAKGVILLRDLFIIGGISLVASFIIFLVLQINRINYIIQTAIIYSIFALSAYSLCIIFNIFRKNIIAIIIAIGLTFIGFIIIILFELMINHQENKELNESLQSYKGGHE